MGAGALVGGALLGGVASGIGGYAAAKEQGKAQARALYAQILEARRAQKFAQDQARRGNEMLRVGADRAATTLGDFYDASRGDLIAGFDRGRGDLLSQAASARGDIGRGMAQGRGDLANYLTMARRNIGQARRDLTGAQTGIESAFTGGAQQGEAALGRGLTGAEAALSPVTGLAGMAGGAAGPISAYDVTGAPSRVSEMLGQDPYAGFEADPGYQFRRQQGEQAIQRAAAARGGRMSGRTLKELAEFNQGLASQEFGNFANRALAARGQEFGAAGAVDQQTLSALLNQAGRSDAARLAAQGAQLSLARQGLGAMGDIARMRSGAGQNLAQMLYGTGQNIAGARGGLGRGLAGLTQNLAGMSQQTGTNMANIATAGGQNLANIGMNVGGRLAGMGVAKGQGLSGLGMGVGTNLANLITQGAQNRANNLMQAAGASGSISQSLTPAYAGPAQSAGAGTAAIGNAFGSTINNLMMLGAGGYLGGGGGFGRWGGNQEYSL